MKEILKGSDLMMNYLKSIDEDLKGLQVAFNQNFKVISQEIKELNKKIDERVIKNTFPTNTDENLPK